MQCKFHFTEMSRIDGHYFIHPPSCLWISNDVTHNSFLIYIGIVLVIIGSFGRNFVKFVSFLMSKNVSIYTKNVPHGDNCGENNNVLNVDKWQYFIWRKYSYIYKIQSHFMLLIQNPLLICNSKYLKKILWMQKQHTLIIKEMLS